MGTLLGDSSEAQERPASTSVERKALGVFPNAGITHCHCPCPQPPRLSVIHVGWPSFISLYGKCILGATVRWGLSSSCPQEAPSRVGDNEIPCEEGLDGGVRMMSRSHNHAHDGSAHTAMLGSSESSNVSAAGNPRLREGGMSPGHQAAEEASWWEGGPTTAFPAAARWKTRPRSRWASGDHQPSATRPTVLGKLRRREAAPGPTKESSRQRQGPRPGLPGRSLPALWPCLSHMAGGL